MLCSSTSSFFVASRLNSILFSGIVKQISKVGSQAAFPCGVLSPLSPLEISLLFHICLFLMNFYNSRGSLLKYYTSHFITTYTLLRKLKQILILKVFIIYSAKAALLAFEMAIWAVNYLFFRNHLC